METILKHIGTGNVGIFTEKRNGYFGEVTIILLANGQRYFAPSNEFKIASDADKVLAYPIRVENLKPKIIPEGETKPPITD